MKRGLEMKTSNYKVSAKANRYDVMVEGLKLDLSPLVLFVSVRTATDGASNVTLSVSETENFDVRKSFSEWVDKNIHIKTLKKNGDVAHEEIFKIKGLSYGTAYAFDMDFDVRWDIELEV